MSILTDNEDGSKNIEEKMIIVIIIYYSTCIFADCEELIVPVGYEGVTYEKNEKEKKKSNMMDMKYDGYVLSTSLTTLLLNNCYYKFHLEYLNLEYIIMRCEDHHACKIM